MTHDAVVTAGTVVREAVKPAATTTMAEPARTRTTAEPDLQVRRTYRGYLGGDVLAHVTAWSEQEAVERLLEHVPSLTRVVVMSGMDEQEVWLRVR